MVLLMLSPEFLENLHDIVGACARICTRIQCHAAWLSFIVGSVCRRKTTTGKWRRDSVAIGCQQLEQRRFHDNRSCFASTLHRT